MATQFHKRTTSEHLQHDYLCVCVSATVANGAYGRYRTDVILPTCLFGLWCSSLAGNSDVAIDFFSQGNRLRVARLVRPRWGSAGGAVDIGACADVHVLCSSEMYGAVS